MTPPNIAIYNWIRQAFDFRSRASRSDFWWPRLFVFVINLVLLFVFFSGLGPERTQAMLEVLASGDITVEALGLEDLPPMSLFALVFAIVFGLMTFIPDLSVAWRRFHDMGRPGWLHLVFLLAGSFIVFATIVEHAWLAMPGNPGPNRFGPDPRDRWR
ncbi:MAG: DUF805 domain-containing protein [Pseudomonadota bacterium]